MYKKRVEKKPCTYGPDDASGVVWARFCRPLSLSLGAMVVVVGVHVVYT
jgi:hypothetical protein